MGQQGNGFTLVELAIALMVIGLLIGGVLKGQELIENARITRMIKDIKDYDTAVMIFRTTYNDLPGDMRNPTRLPNCNAAPCNVVASDAGRGQIGDRDKSEQFWRHLFHAGLISSINEDPGYVDNFKTISPQNPFTHHTAIFFAPTGNPALTDEQGFNRYFLFDRTVSANGNGFLAHRALAIDSKIDDGKPLSGIAQVQHPESPIWLGATCFDGTEYLRTSGLRCSFSVISSSMND